MSTQSGITASDELLEVFKNFNSDALVIKFSTDSTQLVPDHEFPQSSSVDLSTTFKQLNEYFSKNHPNPAYIIVSVSPNEYCFISFIPDTAPIRHKMLYASSKNTLIMSLGSNNFVKNQIFAWSELEELTHGHYKASIKESSDNPLTYEEKLLSEINSLQSLSLAESQMDKSFKQELASMSSNQDKLLFDFNCELDREFKTIFKDTDDIRSKLITFCIDSTEEKFKLTSSNENIKVDSLISTLSSISSSPEPQYSLYNYAANKFAFIYSCPSGSKVKARMIYASLKQALLNYLKKSFKEHHLEIDKSLEVGDMDELDIGELHVSEGTTPSSSSGKAHGLKFSKPKGPRRR